MFEEILTKLGLITNGQS